MKKFITHIGLLALTIFATIFLGLSAVNAQSTAYADSGLAAPTVTSDKADYSPGEVAHITGTGWTLDQGVHVEFKETPDYPDYHIYDLDVDADGNWQIDYPIEIRHLGVTFTVLVNGKQSLYTATTIFTDAGKCLQSVSASGGGSVCEGATSTVSANYTTGSNGNDPTKFQWYSNSTNTNTNGTLITGATSISYNPPTSTSGTKYYYCILTNTNGVCGTTTNQTSLTTSAVAVTVTANGTIALSSAAGTNTQTKCVNNAITNITYAIGGTATGANVTGLPAGVSGSYNAGVFTISGTPTASGTSNYTVTTTGSSCTNPSLSGTITVTVDGTIALSSAQGTNTQTICVNNAITNITYSIGGTATGATVTGLPAGLTASYKASSTTFTITGTPTESGSFNYSVTTTGSSCVNPAATGTITVNPPPDAVATPASQTICSGTSIDPIVLSTSPIVSGTTYSWTRNSMTNVTGIPASGTGDISGTLTNNTTTVKTVTFTITPTANGCSGRQIIATVTVRPNFTPGAINTTGETICYNGDPGVIGSATAASGGDGVISYKWQADGVDISGANSATYDPGTLTATTVFTRFAKDGACHTSFTQSTGSWTVTVRDQFTDGAIATTGETICYNGDPGVIGSVTAASGGNGVISYKWQADGVDISGANSATYDPGTLTATTVFTRFAKDGACHTSFTQSSGSWTVTVRDQFTDGAIATTGETICYNGNPGVIGSVTAASGGNGVISYQWQADGVDISGANSATYDPGTLTATTVFTRFAKDGACHTSFTQSTGSWTVTVRDQFTDGAIATRGETICYNGDPGVIGSVTAASGGNGVISYKWQADGVDISGANSATYDPGTLTATTVFTRFAKDGACHTSFTQSTGSWTVTVRDQFTDGAIATTGETICYNGDPGVIGSVTAASGGNGVISYQWQADGVDISGANSATYDPGTLTATKVFTRFAKDGACQTSFTQSSGSWTVTVRDQFTDGAIATTGETICYNGDPGVIGSITAASGGNGVISYQWQADGVDISGANSATYDPGTLTATTIFTRFAKDGACHTSFTQSSGSWTVTVRDQFTDGAIATTGETICYNGDPGVIGSITAASGGNGVISYQWQADGVDISGANSATYDPGTLTATTVFTRFAKDGACHTSFTQSSGSWTVTVRDQFTDGAIATTGETICYNGNPGVIGSVTAASGGNGVISYQWQADGVDISGANSATYDPGTLTATTVFTRFAKDGACHTSFTQSTGSWTVTVRDQFTDGAIATTGETICYNGDPGVIGSTTDASGGDGNITYKWESSLDRFATAGTVIGSATSSSYDPPTGLTATTSYRRYAHDGTCNTSFEVSSGVWTVTVKTLSVAPTSAGSSDYNFCANVGGTLNLTASGGTLGTGAVVKWYSGTCGGTYIGTGNPLNISKPTITTTYFARYEGDCNTTGCASVLVTVKVVPHVTTSPSNQSVTYGGSASFTVVAEATGITYQWQEKVGLSWANINNGGIYSGANGATLTLSLPTVAMTGYKYRCIVSGDCSPSATSGEASLTIAAAPTTTTLILSAPSVRYMDNLTMTAQIKPSVYVTGSPLTGSVEFFIGTTSYGTAVVVPIPGSPDGSVQAMMIKQVTNLPADHTVKAVFTSTNSNYSGGQNTNPLTVVPRNATPYASTGLYTGDGFAWTTGPSTSTATVTMVAAVKDANTPTGDVRGAKVSFYFVNGTTLTPISSAQNLPVGLINASDGSVGTASAIVQLNIGSLNSNSFQIAIKVTGAYTNNPWDALSQTIVTVSKPVTGGFICGGSNVKNINSSGYVQGAANLNTDYQFDIQYNSSGTNPKGKVNILVRSWYNKAGILDSKLHTYLIRTNAIALLAVSTPTATGTFSAKANMDEQLDNGTVVAVESGGTFQMVAFQNKCDQQIAITYYRRAGGVWFSSKWNATSAKTDLQAVNSGSKVYVAGGGTCSGTQIAAKPVETPTVEIEPLQLKVYPNPSTQHFTVKLQSRINEKAQLKVVDVSGRPVYLTEGSSNQTYRFGDNFPSGSYFLKVTQGGKQQIVKLIKLK